MLKKTILTLVLALAFSGSACSGAGESSETPLTSSTKNNLKLLPENTRVIFYANIDELRKTEIGRELQSDFEKDISEDDDEDYRDFVRRTGLNPEKDISEVLFGGFNVDDEDMEGGIIVTGKFDSNRIVEYARSQEPHDFDEGTYRGHTVYRIDEHGHHGDEHTQLTFLGSNTAVFGNESWVHAVIDGQEDERSKSILDNAHMSQFISQVPVKNHLWGVFDLEHLSDSWMENLRRNNSFKGTQSIENMKSLVFYTQFGEKTDVYLKGNFTTEEEATTIADAFNGFKAMAKLMVSDDREAVDMLNGIEISTSGSFVEVTTRIDKTFIDKLREKQGRFSEGKMM